MSEVVFKVAGETYTARILANGLSRQHSVREILDASDEIIPENMIRFPFTVKLLPDDDFAILPAGSLTPENSDVIVALVTKLQETEE